MDAPLAGMGPTGVLGPDRPDTRVPARTALDHLSHLWNPSLRAGPSCWQEGLAPSGRSGALGPGVRRCLRLRAPAHQTLRHCRSATGTHATCRSMVIIANRFSDSPPRSARVAACPVSAAPCPTVFPTGPARCGPLVANPMPYTLNPEPCTLRRSRLSTLETTARG